MSRFLGMVLKILLLFLFIGGLAFDGFGIDGAGFAKCFIFKSLRSPNSLKCVSGCGGFLQIINRFKGGVFLSLEDGDFLFGS